MALQGEALLSDTLSRHLATLTTNPATVFAWEGMAFDATDGANRPYLQVSHVPNTTRSETFGPSKDLPGFLIVTVVGSVFKSQGDLTIFDLRNIAAQVIAHFPTTLTLHTTDFRIGFIQPASMSAAFLDGNDVRVPVNIPYLATS